MRIRAAVIGAVAAGLALLGVTATPASGILRPGHPDSTTQTGLCTPVARPSPDADPSDIHTGSIRPGRHQAGIYADVAGGGLDRSASAVQRNPCSAANQPEVRQAPGMDPATPPSPTGSATGGPDLSPLAGMIQSLATTSHDFSLTTKGSSMSGAVQPSDAAASAIARSPGLEISEVVTRGKVYVEADLGSDLDKEVGIKPHTWMRLDPTQIAANNQLLVQPDGSDPVDLPGIMTGMTSLRQVDAEHLAGTLDLTRVTGHTLPDPDEVAKAGAAAKRVPFEVTADTLGRIAEFRVDASGFDPTLSLDVVYDHYGSGTPVIAPGSSVPAPRTLYSVFND